MPNVLLKEASRPSKGHRLLAENRPGRGWSHWKICAVLLWDCTK